MNPNGKHNRLIDEKSPYLLQHAYNPVNWHSWNDEAFEEARNEDKPIFLSIGYSTCHWCHVMERESFEDEEVAQLLNEYFVSIKVDREERPDIDSIYMSFCQALTGQGGWPLTIFMTPDKKPFYAGTYFPKRSKYGRAGLMEILRQINMLWENERQKLIASSEKILETVEDSMNFSDKREIGKETIDKTFDELDYFFDPVYGGIGNAPKFPTPHNLMFLLRYWKSNKNEEALKMVEKTLISMYKGGIFDHIGFGFSRYSVDEKWLVPHFEKMLYDNALLAIVYLEAYQATKKSIYKEVAEKIFSYVLRDMTSPEGGFYSAEDADSEGEEGKFYVWTEDEIESVLGEKDGQLFCKYYDITKGGNFEGKSIPNLIETEPHVFKEDLELKEQFENMIKQLFSYREKRIHPHKDDKILTSWNGLMIAALAYGGRVLRNESYIEASKKSIDFIYNNLVNEEGRLLARYRDGESAYLAYLEDYAFMIWGLVELYQSTYDVAFLDKALKLTDDMIKLYWDEKDGGFFLYGEDNEQLIIRPKSLYDGAIPSGNSVAAYNLLRLSKITGNSDLEDKVSIMFNTFGGEVKKNPNAYTYFIIALLYANTKSKKVVIAGEKEEKDTQNLISIVNKEFLPFVTTILNDGSYDLHNLIPFTINQGKIEKKATAYVCENFICNHQQLKVRSLT